MIVLLVNSFSGLKGKEINNYFRFSFYLSYHIYKIKTIPGNISFPFETTIYTVMTIVVILLMLLDDSLMHSSTAHSTDMYLPLLLKNTVCGIPYI